MIDRNLKLSKDFTLGEFLHPEYVVNDLPIYILHNLTKLAQALQPLRTRIGKPFIISSGYRTKKHNKAVGGAPHSYHLAGLAADFMIKGLTADEGRKVIGDWDGGVELGIKWIHLDLGPKRRFHP